MLFEQQTHLFPIFLSVLTMSSRKKSESKGSTGKKAAQAGAKSTTETARDAASPSELTRLTLTPASSEQVLQSDKEHMDEWGMGVNGCDSHRNRI